MKKIVFLILFGLYVAAIDAQTGTIGSLMWSITDGELLITGNGAIPDFDYTGKEYAPWYNFKNDITSIRMEGITMIGFAAFYYLENVISADISATVTKIDNNAFCGCSSLKSIFIPASVSDVLMTFVQGCSSLTEILVDPDNQYYTSVDGVLFNRSMNTLYTFPPGRTGHYSIPNSVTSIYYFAFNKSLLSSVVIPASVSAISDVAFADCSNLLEIVNEKSNPQSIEINTFRNLNFNDCVLRVPAGSEEIYKNTAGWEDFVNIEGLLTGTIGTLIWEIQGSVIYIRGEGAMQDYLASNFMPWRDWKDLIKHVVIDEGVTRVGRYTFCDHSEITSVSISGTVETIGGLAFGYCEKLASIDIPPSVTSIEVGAFVSCSGLTSVTIPSSVTFIGNSAFSSCSGLTSITIPSSVTYIDMGAFSSCSFTSVTIPESVTFIGANIFSSCDELTSISVDPANPAYFSENGVLFNKDMTEIVSYPAGRQGDYSIPESVTSIGNGAFMGSTKLSSITIPASVTKIDDYAFATCLILPSVTIPTSVVSIGEYVFINCGSLTSVFIPATVTTIGNYCFSRCVMLSQIINTSPTPQEITANVFSNVPISNCILRVPAVSIDHYQNAEVWKTFKNIVPIEVEIILEKNEIFLLPDATATLTATITGDTTNSDVISWTSSNMDAAIVDPVGKVTAISPGTTVITGVIGSNEVMCTVTVFQPGKSIIEGTVNNAGVNNLRVNLYIKVEETGQTKRGIVGGYVLLATTVPNGNGEYSFNNLPEGSYQVEVVIDDFEPEATDELSLFEDKKLEDIDFILDENEGRIIVVSNISTGTKELFASELKAYPNPFTDVIHLAGIVVETWHAASLRVINAAGTVVHTQTITNPDETIHLRHLPAGLYFIRLEKGGIVKFIKTIKIQ